MDSTADADEEIAKSNAFLDKSWSWQVSPRQTAVLKSIATMGGWNNYIQSDSNLVSAVANTWCRSLREENFVDSPFWKAYMVKSDTAAHANLYGAKFRSPTKAPTVAHKKSSLTHVQDATAQTLRGAVYPSTGATDSLSSSVVHFNDMEPEPWEGSCGSTAKCWWNEDVASKPSGPTLAVSFHSRIPPEDCTFSKFCPGVGAGDRSGWSVDMSHDGSRMIIGAPEYEQGGTAVGEARIYERNTKGAWEQQDLETPDLSGATATLQVENQLSGYSVSMSASGDYAIAGSPGTDANWGGPANRGLFELYKRNHGRTDGGYDMWEKKDCQVQTGSPSVVAGANYELGKSVSISDDGLIIAIGEPGYDPDTLSANTGTVRVATVDWGAAVPTTWEEFISCTYLGAAQTDLKGDAAGDKAGWAVSVVHDAAGLIRVAIGSPYYHAMNYGRVRVFERNTAASTPAWAQLGPNIDGATNNEHLGYSVKLLQHGTQLYVAMGAPYAASGGTSRGYAKVMKWNSAGSAWARQGAVISGGVDSDDFGVSVSLSMLHDDKTLLLAVGGNKASNAGFMKLYKLNTAVATDATAWTQISADTAFEGDTGGDKFGFGLALSGNGARLAVGAYGDDPVVTGGGNDGGTVTVYDTNAEMYTDTAAAGTSLHVAPHAFRNYHPTPNTMCLGLTNESNSITTGGETGDDRKYLSGPLLSVFPAYFYTGPESYIPGRTEPINETDNLGCYRAKGQNPSVRDPIANPVEIPAANNGRCNCILNASLGTPGYCPTVSTAQSCGDPGWPTLPPTTAPPTGAPTTAPPTPSPTSILSLILQEDRRTETQIVGLAAAFFVVMFVLMLFVAIMAVLLRGGGNKTELQLDSKFVETYVQNKNRNKNRNRNKSRSWIGGRADDILNLKYT